MFSTDSWGCRSACTVDIIAPAVGAARTPEGLGYRANADQPSYLETLPALGV